MQTVSKQIETAAITAYCALRAKGTTHAHAARCTQVPLSTAARTPKARAMRSTAGLAEVAVYAQFNPVPFVTVEENYAVLTQMQVLARYAQHARDLQIARSMY